MQCFYRPGWPVVRPVGRWNFRDPDRRETEERETEERETEEKETEEWETKMK